MVMTLLVHPKLDKQHKFSRQKFPSTFNVKETCDVNACNNLDDLATHFRGVTPVRV